MMRLLSAFVILLFFLPARSQQFNWAVSMGSSNGAVSPGDRGESIKVDGAGNVISVGGFLGTVDFDPGPGTFNLTALEPDRPDIYIQKLDASGTFLWAKGITGVGNARAYSVDFDAAGNILVGGYFWGTKDFDPGPGTMYLSSAGSADIFILKLDNNGNLIWARKMGGTGPEGAFSIDVDNGGNILSIGIFDGTADFDPGVGVYNLTTVGNYDIFISKLDGAGNFQWAKKIGGPGREDGNSISSDVNGNVIVTGSFGGTVDMDPGPATLNFTAAGSDIFVEKLDASGSLVWAKQMTGTLSSSGSEIITDAVGNIYYTGWFWGTVDFDPGAGVSNFISASGSRDIFVSRLSSDGNLTWVKAIAGPGDEEGISLAMDAASNLYTTGYFRNTVDFNPGAGIFTLSAQNGSDDIFILKLDATGNFAWAVSAGGPSDDRGTSITVTGSGNILATGGFQSSGDFDPGPNTYNLTSAGFDDIFILKLSELTTGIITPENPFQLVAYPNPARETFYLKSKGAINKMIGVEIQNYLGQTLSQFRYKALSNDHNQEIHLTGQPGGIYYLRITIDGKTYLKTISLNN